MKTFLIFIARTLSTKRYTLVVFDRRRSFNRGFTNIIETEHGNLFDLLS